MEDGCDIVLGASSLFRLIEVLWVIAYGILIGVLVLALDALSGRFVKE